ncbi:MULTISPECIES: large exoprotein [Microbacterium]|uniref:Large exoprotein n=1 Tax=Microbacterium wangchenii TaxID=2541726 RepID=A0ABX5STH2_9MICO|nr:MULTISPECIES: large exoprotein [Microbacterium]MCK6067634.1 large exoprotein [Microbacterium sp. EYE_512]QBR89444.1 large exoprotein [Microbacterium wangchenii]TXK11117.1 large exoprotein [Microbacterium wangchenii]
MGGQVLGGGVIVAVAVVLWLVYLLPSWASRYQYTSAERNAVRLNQALRVLAETSETPQEVRLELNARTALAQQRLARRVQAEQEQTELVVARARLEAAKEESAAERELARARRAEAIEAARAERAAARSRPAFRRARARRRMRLAATALGVAGLAATGAGVWVFLSAASAALLWAGGATTLLSVVALHRMSRVAARAVVREVPAVVAERVATPMPDLAVGRPRAAAWTPRELPRPLVSSAGSRAAAVLDEHDARAALRAAAREEALRDLAAQNQPPSIDEARTARASEFSRMGYVDDAEIEDHVRRLLARRAVGA